MAVDIGEEEETSNPNVVAGPAAAGGFPRARSQAFLLWDFLGHGQILRDISSETAIVLLKLLPAVWM